MRGSTTATLTVPEIGGGNNPSRLANANHTPVRVAVRNTGGTALLIAFEVNAVSNVQSIGDVYQLPVGGTEVFVCAPGQSLFAASVGGGGEVSVTTNEAIPVKYFMES